MERWFSMKDVRPITTLPRIDSLAHERQDVVSEFDKFIATDLKEANKSLAAKKVEAIHPLERAAWEKDSGAENAGGSPGAAQAWWRTGGLR